MNTKEHETYLKEMKELTEKLLKSKKASQDFYKSVGIHTKSGNLTAVYKSAKVIGLKTVKV